MCSQYHADNNTRRWIPTFPKQKYAESLLCCSRKMILTSFNYPKTVKPKLIILTNVQRSVWHRRRHTQLQDGSPTNYRHRHCRPQFTY